MSMSKKDLIRQELEELDSPILSQWQGKAKDWSMPEHYLTNLTNEVVAQSGKNKLAKTFVLWSSLSWKIAASILFLLASTWLFYNYQPIASPAASLAGLEDVSIEEIQDYVLNNIDDFDMNMLEEIALEMGSETPFQIEDVLLDSDINEEYQWLEENTEIDLF